VDATILAKQRAHIERRQMPDLATFYRAATPTAADRGQASSGADVIVLADVKCRIGSLGQSASEGVDAGQVQSKMRVDIFIPATTVRPSDAEYVLITTQSNRRIEISGSVWVSENRTLKINGLEDR
jgi:hypothetical protein